jgi:glycosyltransferase involved in cell wall biosynthesis
MRVLQLYNNYQSGGGGETQVVQFIHELLTERGHSVHTCIRDNHTIQSLGAKVSAFVTGMYSPSAKTYVSNLIKDWRPDVVHVHNLYPLFSPSVLAACNEVDVPVVMSVHNYGLTCPVASHFSAGQTCQRCVGGREYHCLLRNCKGSVSASAGYSLRRAVARTCGQFGNRVNRFLAVSKFVKDKMVESGYDPTKIDIVENGIRLPQQMTSNDEGQYVAYVGGINIEKGVETLISAAINLPQCKFVFVGDGPNRAEWAARAPANCSFLGGMDRASVDHVYRNARFTVVPSLWWEPFGLVAIEAMSHGRAVVAASSGALSELVRHGKDGLLFPPGDQHALREAIRFLWNSPERAKEMGINGFQRARQRFGEDSFADRLLLSYGAAGVKNISVAGLCSAAN